MEIQKLNFKKREIEINETYIDTDGKMKERKKKILISTNELEETCLKGRDDQDENNKNTFSNQ